MVAEQSYVGGLRGSRRRELKGEVEVEANTGSDSIKTRSRVSVSLESGTKPVVGSRVASNSQLVLELKLE